MSDLANHSYHIHRDTPDEINRYFGFFRPEKAAAAKVEIGQSLTELVRAAHGTVEGEISPKSWWWFYHTDSLTVLVNDTTLEISLGARHKLKATADLPCAGIISEAVVSIFPYHPRFMQSQLAAEMKKYLNQYANS